MIALPRRLGLYSEIFASVGAELGIDPYVLAGVCWRESAGGATLTPRGPAGRGDFELLEVPDVWGKRLHGHGHGLMQIDDRTWSAWLNSHDWTKPDVNIRKGGEILHSGLEAWHGLMPPALAQYNAGRARVAKACESLTAAGVSLASEEAIAILDSLTTGHDYVSWVLTHVAEWKRAAGLTS